MHCPFSFRSSRLGWGSKLGTYTLYMWSVVHKKGVHTQAHSMKVSKKYSLSRNIIDHDIHYALYGCDKIILNII